MSSETNTKNDILQILKIIQKMYSEFETLKQKVDDVCTKYNDLVSEKMNKLNNDINEVNNRLNSVCQKVKHSRARA